MRSKTMNMSEGRPLKLLTQQPFGSLGMALTTYAGQNYGARHTDRVREGLRDAMLAMAVFSGAIFIVMQLLGPTIIRAFVSDAEVVALGGRALQLTSRFYVFLGTISLLIRKFCRLSCDSFLSSSLADVFRLSCFSTGFFPSVPSAFPSVSFS